MNWTVCSILKTLGENAKKDWKAHLPKLAFAYNATVHRSTGFSPMYLMFGREARLPLDLMFQEATVDEGVIENKDHKKFVENWHDSMKEAMELARVNMEKSADYNKRYRDKKAKIVEVNVGDKVLVRNYREKGGTGKLRSFWEEAIFVVEGKKEGLPVYQVKNIKKEKDVRVVHRNKLMKCEELPLDVFDAPQEPKKSKKVAGEKRKITKQLVSDDVAEKPVGVINDEGEAEQEVEGDPQAEDVVVIVEEVQRKEAEKVPQAILIDDSMESLNVAELEESEVLGTDEVELGDSDVEEMVVGLDESGPDDDEHSTGEGSTVAYGEEQSAGEDTTIAYEEELDDTLVGEEEFDFEIAQDVETPDVETEELTEPDVEQEVDVEDSPEPEVRRSRRNRVPTTKFSYDQVGGNPVMARVDGT